jgi:hypothetical protein
MKLPLHSEAGKCPILVLLESVACGQFRESAITDSPRPLPRNWGNAEILSHRKQGEGGEGVSLTRAVVEARRREGVREGAKGSA